LVSVFVYTNCVDVDADVDATTLSLEDDFVPVERVPVERVPVERVLDVSGCVNLILRLPKSASVKSSLNSINVSNDLVYLIGNLTFGSIIKLPFVITPFIFTELFLKIKYENAPVVK
jgi:hypothetical protein